MKSSTIFYALCLLYLFITSVYSQDSVKIENDFSEGTAHKVRILIAIHESEFKNAVAKKVTFLLEELTIHVELIGIKYLKKKESENYDAIVIINEVRAWHLNFHTRKFFNKLDEQERKKVIMISSAITDWETKEKDIDAMTVASEMNNVNTLAKKIFKKIIILLKLD